MRVVAVLRTRGLSLSGVSEFKPLHVQALQKQVEKWAPFVEFECLSDVDVPGVKCIPLEHRWPGWWAKIELFRPSLPGDFLFVDLDTVIVGAIDDILECPQELTLLRDFYRDGKKLKEGLGGGLIYFPEDYAARKPVWDFFTENPALAMRLYPRGDQHLFERFYLNTAKRWQDVVPGQVVSWKVHCQNGVPPDARLVAFHGQPRPWAVGQFLHLYR